MSLEEFLKKFRELRDKSPRLFATGISNENSWYSDAIAYSKNAYWIFTAGWVEDCYYGEFLVKCKDCVDCLKIENSELCYQCTECTHCYNCDFLLNCHTTRDSSYSFGLRDCDNCFLSANRSHKSYLFKNKQYTKDDYAKTVADYKKNHTPQRVYSEFLGITSSAIRNVTTILNSEDCVGDHISNAKNAYFCFDVVNAQNYLYSYEAGYGKDSCDLYVCGAAELLYECVGVSDGAYNCSFCVGCTGVVNCELCGVVYNSQDCFGCFYLKGRQYYILNTPYSPEDYKKEAGALRAALIQSGKLGLDLFVRDSLPTSSRQENIKSAI